jgi:Schlafen group 3, DNA/RNA helicase domain
VAAFYSASVADFLAADPRAIADRLAAEQSRHFRVTEAAAIGAWERTIAVLRATLGLVPIARDWRLLLEYPLLRLGRRIDVVLIAEQMVLALEFKVNASGFAAADLRQVEDYALDLSDFHAASRAIPIVPILVATEAAAPESSWPLPMNCVADPMLASAASLGPLIAGLARHFPPLDTPIDPVAWADAVYLPVPGIVEAARRLYAGHGVAEITTARAGSGELERTTAAILDAVRKAEAERQHLVLFVTGVPGAGKTLVGLNVVFGAGHAIGAAYLTGNPTLVHVLREALARDAARGRPGALRQARHGVEGKIQRLPFFRDDYVGHEEKMPAEHVVVIDEAQRCWSREYAIRKTRDRRPALQDSEPAHLLEIMARQPDWAVLVCLVGGGQEIHTGEGGLAEWGLALTSRPFWQVQAAPAARKAADPRQRLPLLPSFTATEALELTVPARAIRNAAAPSWVNAVLADDAAGARRIAEAEGGVPFRLTRDLAAMRRALRARCMGGCRAGLLASSGARRLRAEGLGAELPHMDIAAVTRWFLDRWPKDVRASDALEVPATEFCCQGLELDYTGLCWGGDLIRHRGRWQVRDFRGSRWTIARGAEAIANTMNTCRVLLTRARYETIIWVPTGSVEDETRPPDVYDAVANFLLDCGVHSLEDMQPSRSDASPQHAIPLC